MQHILDAINICVGSVHATLTKILGMRKLISALLPSLDSLHSAFISYFVYVFLYG